MNTIYIILKQMKKQGCIFLVLLLVFADSKSQNINTTNKSGPLGTSINTLTGNFFLKRTDMYNPGRLIDMDITFNYNSFRTNLKRSYGSGWSFEYDIYYKTDTIPGRKIIVWGSGRNDKYDSLSTTAFHTPKGFYSALTAPEAGKLLLTDTDGWKYYFDNPTHRRVTKIEEPNGNALTFNYVDTLLQSMINTTGQTISFQYNAQGLLTKVTDETASPTIAYTYSYNTAGNLITVTDPLGGTYRYTYLVNGPMKTMSDKNNNTVNIIYYPNFSTREIIGCNKRISATYDQLNRKTIITDYMDEGETNQVTTYVYEKSGDLYWLKSIKGNCCGFDKQYEYDENGNVLRETDANGNAWNYTYDDYGNKLTETNPSGKSAVYTYTANHKYIAGYRDFNGNTTSYEYDNKGNVIKIIEPDNNVYTATYNTNGEIISTTDAKGNTFTCTYNTFGQPVEINGPEDYHKEMQFDSRGNPVTLTDANGNSAFLEFDVLNRLKKSTDAQGKLNRFEYDAAGNLVKFTNARSQLYEMKYDGANRMVKIINPVSNAISIFYDPMDNVKTITDPLNNVIARDYDSKNRLSSNTDPLGNKGNISYDANGNMVAISLSNGRTVHATYDVNNKVTKIQDDESVLYGYTYDDNGNITSITDATGSAINLKYDKLNRVTRVTNALGNSRQYTYDKNNNIILVTDENNQSSHLTYDGLDRIVSYTDPIGATIHLGYDKQGNVTSITDQKGNITQYGYDALNRRTSMKFADGTSNFYTYDDAGNLTVLQHTDGTQTTFTYNQLNQVTQKVVPGGEVFNYTYDALGRILTATNNSGMVTLTYDALGRVLSESFNNKTVAYAYNDAGRTKTIIYPDNTSVIREYDTRNRLVKILKDSVLVALYDYNNTNQLISQTMGNGLTSTYQYDFANRLSKITTGANIQETTFGYDKLGNKLSVNRLNYPAWSEQMTYDANSRLTYFNRGSSLQNNYTYDNLGNRVSANINGVNNTYIINNLNQLTSVNGTPLQYDERGNLVFDGVYHKFYNGAGQLIKDSSGINNVHTYTYDAFGRRVTKTIAGASYKYTYSGLTAVEERDAADQILNQTVFADFLNPVLNKKNNASFYYHRNELGSIEAVTDAGGQISERYLYDAYGKPSIFNSSNQPVAGSVTGNRFGLTGQEYDSATASYRFFYRTYSPDLGVFNQRDLIEYEDGMGMYQYVGNNPANGLDILGLKDCYEEKNNTDKKVVEYFVLTGSTAVGAPKFILVKILKKITLEVGDKAGVVALPFNVIDNVTRSMDFVSEFSDRSTMTNIEKGGEVGLSLIGTGATIGAAVVGSGAAVVGGVTVGTIAVGALVVKGVDAGTEYALNKYYDNNAKNIEKEAYEYAKQQGMGEKWLEARKRMIERQRRYRERNPCDDGDQEFPDPYDPKNASMSLLWSFDPNEIIGPKGIEEPKWVSVNDRMPYTIYCENHETATAPARFIRITTPVQPKQDPNTLELGSFGFNNQEFEIPAGNSAYYTRLDCRDSLGIYVDVIAGYDVTKNEIFWEFKAIDPVTLLPSEDPAKGVLLLRDSVETKYGHGFVNFSMKPLSTANTLDLIDADAEIVFDENEMIPTNIHTNTIDAIAPTSTFASSTVTNHNVTFTWSGTDDTGGVGVDYYTLYVSMDGINYSIFAPEIRRTDTTFTLAEGGQYCFFVLATDRVGNAEQMRQNVVQCVNIQSTALPVTWLHFNAVNQKTDNILTWATAAEANAKEFIIERSFDGVHFESIGKVSAKGNSISETTYNYTDKHIDKLNSNTFFYRLKEVDVDGQYTYSNTILIRYSSPGVRARSVVYPNPARNMVNVLLGDKALVGTEAFLFDMSGKMLKKIRIEANLEQVDLSAYTHGVYLLKLSNGEILRIIKQ
ncbi:hypothetical protein DC498_07270 [Terrimonas sp.]|uniref:RHS repeat-associated core domain-containing protein n=1 Tax=Terrimonas sp. TaxID=1914338 RepID=UPI000D50A156|nr:RHS repeat-associated core domain-containing protein [Terrimonas sp.]PVD52724.1 hypothetical protein DC498_07270 [Terrimonas sp.]